MGLKIYNTLTGEKEEFKPLHPPHVRMYVCGPTVYDDPHIGHIRGAFVFDVIRKYLQCRGYQVKFVRNITDVDDKIIEKALQAPGTSERPEGLKQACEEVALKYTSAYQDALKELGIDPPDEEPRATQQIPKMIEMIQHLIEKGMAYAAQGSVYFSVNGFKEYGKLSHQSPEQLLKGHRMEPEAGKKDPLDFALWKNAKPEEPQWPSPWGPGRPGWHIECSVMSQAKFGETLDIHGGGVDLVFPHHENEIAQSEACWEKPFANYWMHNGLLTVEGQKMSKSVGNVVSAEDILQKGYHPDDLKLFFLQSHYRSPVDFSWEKMEQAKKGRKSFELFFIKCKQIENRNNNNKVSDLTKGFVQQWKENFKGAMDDDFNTPEALAALFVLQEEWAEALFSSPILQYEVLNKMQKQTGAKESLPDTFRIGAGDILHVRQTLIELGTTLGFFSKEPDVAPLPEEASRLIQKREELRKRKNFKEADQIRNQLEQLGVLLEDSNMGPIWLWKE